MGFIQQVSEFISSNGPGIIAIVLGVYGIAEIIVRLTPTKTDDKLLERAGDLLKKAIPNNKAVGGVHGEEPTKEGEKK